MVVSVGDRRTIDELELFIEHFDVEPELLWKAFKRGAATMDLDEVDDATRTARLSTGVALTSWEDRLVATVVPAASGADLVVRGRSKGSPLGSNWGQDFRAHEVQKRLRAAVRNALAG